MSHVRDWVTKLLGQTLYAMGHKTALIAGDRSKLAFCRETEFIA